MQTLRDLLVTSNFDEYEKKSAQMVQPVKGATSVAFIFEGDVIVVDDSRACIGSYICNFVCNFLTVNICYSVSFHLDEQGRLPTCSAISYEVWGRIPFINWNSIYDRLLTENPVKHLAAIGVAEVCAVCDDFVQQECYRPVDMAAVMDTHADVTYNERSENSSFWNLSMPYDHTPPSIAVPQTFSSHED
ncbi:hypothetical protein Tco_1004262 [Tanacetum coccineum]|uniref:Uncharacterized protein n=1 Tax=Tanacetum coccineum TaxID=301880 RepID=A0ABQ5FCD0_9ASTR